MTNKQKFIKAAEIAVSYWDWRSYQSNETLSPSLWNIYQENIDKNKDCFGIFTQVWSEKAFDVDYPEVASLLMSEAYA